MDNLEAVIKSVKDGDAPYLFNENDVHTVGPNILVVPRDKQIVDLQQYVERTLPAPQRIRDVATMTTVESFIRYMSLFMNPNSAVFVKDDPHSPSVTGIIDYHGTSDGADSLNQPHFCDHRAVYSFPLSEQIRAWARISGEPLSHADMATFIAERQHDICNPPLDWMMVDAAELKIILELLNIHDDANFDDGALQEDADSRSDEPDDRYIPRSALYKLRQIRFGSAHRLLQLARTVEISVDAKTVEGYNPKTGERTVTFEEEHETRDRTGRRVIVPDGFLLKVPVWEGEKPMMVPVRMQYRKKPGGATAWFLTLVEWARVVRMTVRAEAERIAKETELRVFYGQPK